MSAREANLAELAQIVGAQHVLADPALIAGALVEPRGLYHGKALALVRPASTAQVAATVAYCHREGLAIVPQGGNTGLVGGQIPDTSGEQIILSLQRLDKVREIDALTDTMTVEAGVTLASAQAAAEGAARLFPLSLASEGACTIGGNLSTNAGGTAVIAYGNARDLACGLEVVLADGRVLNNLSKLRKDNTGYDLKNLFIGAEGTLGIITAAALKLFPLPRSRASALVGLSDPHHVLKFLRLARERAGNSITSFELIPRIGIELVVNNYPGQREPLAGKHNSYVLIELSSQTATGLDDIMTGLLESALDHATIEDAAVASSLQQRRAFWTLRETMSEAQQHIGGSIKHDVSVPVGAAPDFLDAASAAVLAFMPGARIVAFGHLGDGNIHFNVSQPPGWDKSAFLSQWRAVNEVVHQVVADFRGSISAEHGIGQLKRDLLARTKDPVALALMRELKAMLDPRGILNPGKVL
jgi:FAD/FMN-containing dehydrogenase